MEEAQPAEQEETQEQQEIITTENLPTELVEIPGKLLKY